MAKSLLREQINADNITEITRQYALSCRGIPSEDLPPAPTAEELIKDILEKLSLKIESLEKTIKLENIESSQTPHKLELKRFKRKQAEFENLLKQPLNSFKLVPVLYSKVDRKLLEKSRKNFYKKVKPDFLKHLAKNYPDELYAIGICETGIEHMLNGHAPKDKEDNLYNINVDHIIELSGAGRLLSKEGTSIANKYTNLIFLPEQIHQAKNSLNSLQYSLFNEKNPEEWFLMLIPEKPKSGSGLIAIPQERTHPLSGLEVVKKAHHNLITRIRIQIKNLRIAYEKSIKLEFNESFKYPHKKQQVDIELEKITESITKKIRNAFNKASQNDNDKISTKFIKFYNGKKFKSLKNTINKLGETKTTKELKDLFAELDSKTPKDTTLPRKKKKAAQKEALKNPKI